MSKISSMMDIGKSSMMNSQTALQTIGHNIANKSTDGFSRQRVEIEANPPITSGRVRIGTGARTATVTRVNNPFLEKQIAKERSNLGFLKERSDALGRVEQVFNEQVNKGLNHSMGNFFNAFREFANNPESMASRTLVKESGESLAHNFNHVTKQLKDIQSGLDFQITAHVQEINSYAKEIADLNGKIARVEMDGIAKANDERDRRDLLLKKLGELADIRYAEGKDHMVTVSVGGTGVLVAGTDAKTLEVRSTPASKGKREGNVDIYYKNNPQSTPVLLTSQIKGGGLGALVEVRDQVINGLLDNVDQMAYRLANEVNKAHVQGFDRYNQKGVDFFEVPKTVAGAAESITVNLDIRKDVGRIASAGQPGSPGDNRIANIISQIQYKPIMSDGVTTLNDYYDGVVGRVGALTKEANTADKAQEDIVKQLTNIRESISGVSLDEETTKMIEFQKGFDASARLIRTADELFDTVLNLKRM